jgi:hypothetical protein
MGYGCYQVKGNRDAGYHVPSACDQPECTEEIDRGLSYVCGGEPGGEHGCGLYFCGSHLGYTELEDGKTVQLCDRCADGLEPYDPKPDPLEWVGWKLEHESWRLWREDHPKEVADMQLRWDSTPKSEAFLNSFHELA